VSFGVVHEREQRAAQYDLIASGTWTRADLEACFMTGRNGKASRRAVPGRAGEPITVVPTGDDSADLFLWFDDHTFYATTRPADAKFLAERLRPRAKPSVLDQIGTRIDRHATGWIAARREAMDGAVENADLRADFTARLELDVEGLAVAAAFYQPDDAAAERTQRAMAAQLATITDQPLMKLAFPELATERDGTTVRVRGRLPAGLLDKLKEQLLAAMP
jgi:hypothetical protein